jgi:hypothetical protein
VLGPSHPASLASANPQGDRKIWQARDVGFLNWLDRKIDDQYTNEGNPPPPAEESSEEEMVYRSTPWYLLGWGRPRIRRMEAAPPNE